MVVEAPSGVDSEFAARVMAAQIGDQATYAQAVHHYTYELYQEAWAEGLETLHRTLIVCPPDTFKSTTVRHFVERAIVHNCNVRILWLMNAGEQAEKQLMAISQTIKSNNVYRSAFGVQEDSEKQWTKSVLYVKRDITDPEPTLMATGMNGPYQGLHFDIIIIDDPTNQEDVRSPTTMELQRSKVRGVIIDRLLEGGRIVGLLTRWGVEDLVPTFEDMGFTIIVMPVAGDYPWGPTLSPTRFTPEVIEAKRQDKGDMLFALTFMCQPEAAEGNIIRREEIHYWDKDTIPNTPLHIFMGIDPAATAKSYSDYWGFASVGLSIQRNIKYVLELSAVRCEVSQGELEIVKRAQRTAGLRAIGIETIGFQAHILQSMKRRFNLPFREIPYRTRRQVMHKVVGLDRDKVGRAMYLSSEFASGRLLLPKGLPTVDGVSVESELCAVPFGKHDDRLDALAFACILADAHSTPRRFVSIKGF